VHRSLQKDSHFVVPLPAAVGTGYDSIFVRVSDVHTGQNLLELPIQLRKIEQEFAIF
jgi:hypothetical protein